MKLELIEFIVNHKEFQKQIEKDLFNHNTTIVEDVGIFWAKNSGIRGKFQNSVTFHPNITS